MQTQTIADILISAAAFLKRPLQDTARRPLKDLYEAAKSHLLRKFGEGSGVARALELAADKPESPARNAMLVEESAAAGLESDTELIQLTEQLMALLPGDARAIRQNVRVTGRSNRVQVAAGDIIITERHTRRSVITPDERHLDGGQKGKLHAVIADLADRLAGEDGRPRFGAVHAMLQRKFEVGAFALIPNEKFDDVLNFLNQQRAIHRAHLRRRNPAAYQQDFFRAIHARCNELGWDKAQLHQFAVEKLGLKWPFASLRELGSIQLRTLLDRLRREPTPPLVKAKIV